MSTEPVAAALEALREDYDGARSEAENLRVHLEAATARLTKLEIAIKSLEALSVDSSYDGRSPASAAAMAAAEVSPNGHSPLSPDAFVESLPEAVPSRFAAYVPSGGKRLKSKRMIFDLLKTMDPPVTRDLLRSRFFEYYGRADLEKYWVRPDNALNTAIDRAVSENMIIEIPGTDGRPSTFSPGWADAETGEPAFPGGEDAD